jgi:hypothetical protein
MTQKPLRHIAPGQGQWCIPRNELDRGYDNYQSISGGGRDTTTDSPVPIWTKSDVRFEATKELLITARESRYSFGRLYQTIHQHWHFSKRKNCKVTAVEEHH